MLYWLFAAAILGGTALAQAPPAPVRFTEVRSHFVPTAVRVPAAVEARHVSQVASSVSGLVLRVPARDGEAVTAGQLLAEVDVRPLQIRITVVEAQRKEAEARRNAAARNRDRARELFESKVVSQQQYDDSVFEFNAWAARIENLEAEASAIRLDIERANVLAPFAGVLVKRHTEVGQWLRPGDPVCELLAIDSLEVVAEVPEEFLHLAKPGAKVRMRFAALNGLETSGAVAAVIPQANAEARTFPVKIALDNPQGRVSAGMTAEVTLGSGAGRPATVVPKDAITIQGSRQLVYVIQPDNTVAPQPVRLGSGLGEWVEVSGTLRAGQRVVTRGNERLRAGQTVAAQPMEYALP
ncbi:MAG: efflux RND transporter periplasmic adaptor subunit [Bryobacterales bacterium]|nr:efflux RND transporter periplasmic adaptor subunit [Bryobacterales bacterium]